MHIDELIIQSFKTIRSFHKRQIENKQAFTESEYLLYQESCNLISMYIKTVARAIGDQIDKEDDE